jgi:hypothetical protein
MKTGDKIPITQKYQRDRVDSFLVPAESPLVNLILIHKSSRRDSAKIRRITSLGIFFITAFYYVKIRPEESER